MSLPPPWGAAPARAFAPRRVGLDEFPGLLKECGALIGAAPGRLTGFFLLVYFPVVLAVVLGPPAITLPLSAVIGGIGFAGFFAALAHARAGQAPEFADMLRAWTLPAGKLRLLALCSLAPLLGAWAGWCLELGLPTTLDVLAGVAPANTLGARERLEFLALLELGAMPLLFVQPLCVLRPWSGSRTLSGSLLGWLANWRWAFAVTGVSVLVDAGLLQFESQDVLGQLASFAIEVAEGIAENVFTLVLLLRSLEARRRDPEAA